MKSYEGENDVYVTVDTSPKTKISYRIYPTVMKTQFLILYFSVCRKGLIKSFFLRPGSINRSVSFILAVLRENLISAHARKITQINKYSACAVGSALLLLFAFYTCRII